MSDDYPLGCSDATLSRAAGETLLCSCCGREFKPREEGEDLCPRCVAEADGDQER